VVSLPPRRFVERIQKIRTPHDKSNPRWMPHVPVVYPFVPNDEFPRAAQLLKPVLKNVKPFTVKLAKLSAYTSKTGSTMFAVPETNPPKAFSDLQRAIEVALPEYNDLVLKSESGFAPHLTLGQFDKEGIEETVAKWQAQWQPIEWDVKELYMVSRNGDVPFEVRMALPFGDEAPSKEYQENMTTFRSRERRRDTGQSFKLFVSNLSWNVDSQALLEMFKEHRAKKAYVIMDKIRDRSRGYGFVEFDSDSDQQAALAALQGKEVDGRQLLVKLAVETRSQQQAPAGDAGAGSAAPSAGAQ